MAPQSPAGNGPQNPQRFETHPLSTIDHVVGVVSGKGGVGKSTVAAALAVELARQGCSVGILDADVTGPSAGTIFGVDRTQISRLGDLLLPPVTPEGIKVMGASFLLPHDDDPVLWRGPMLAGAIRQFFSDVDWGHLDYLVVDMPPGTGDVALTVFQSLPIDGVVMVSTPQDLVGTIVGKAIKMASRMDIGVIGLVENMAYLRCPHCGESIEPFGPSHLAQEAALYGIAPLDRLPLDHSLVEAADGGTFAQVLPEGFMPLTVEAVRALADRPAPVPDEKAIDRRRAEAGYRDLDPNAQTVDVTPPEE